ncbi:decarboxylating 6-phosphogluconate dehydrogenase [Candidatus Shapirobacteria bacterium]|nr:decarboxylating 6-phosphogluconate dehydrogenase [Candidatus Shapirobacteria bacterium]
MQIGFIGLGKMGNRMVLKLIREGHELIVWNRSEAPIENLKTIAQNLKATKTIQELALSLQKPRVIWTMIPAGDATEEVLSEVKKYVEPGDIIIDGGNAFYKDSERRYEELKTKNIKFLGIGVSGGIIAFEEGYPLMVGGDKSAYEHIIPILDSLAKPKGGHAYFGTGGAGHFVKMIHNGIEYGIMQSLGEGFAVLQKAPYKFDLQKVAKLWQRGTLVSGFMLDRAVEALEKDPKLDNIVGVIAESGEAQWTVEQAKEEGVDVEIIKRSLEFRRRSQTDSKVQNSFAAKMVAALRQAFGGHEVKKK